MTIHDDQVFYAQKAAEAEMRCWRVLDFYKGKVVIAIRDGVDTQDISMNDALGPVEIEVERRDFPEIVSAREYIQWRGLKAALEAYERIRQ